MSVSLRTIGIIAKQMPATLRFYRLVGFAIPANADREMNVDFETPSGIILGFLAEAVAKSSDPSYIEAVGQAMNLQFLCDTPAKVDSLYTSLVQAGYASHTAPWNAFWGQRFARVTDPDGRVVNFYAALTE